MDNSLLNERLKKLRKTTGRTQQDIADYLGLNSGTISSYELGRSEWGLGEVCQLADLYNVSLDYIVGRTDVSTLDMHELLSDVYRENETLKRECISLKNRLGLIKHVIELP